MDFAALALSPPLQQVLAELGYKTPTPVQEAALPLLLAGRDLVAQSPTGSGKTAAFGLPVLAKISLSPRRLQALVVCPTRELGAQVASEIRRLGRKLPGFQVLVVSGGQPARAQIHALEKGAHVVVGTPGRLLDLLDRGALDTSALRTVVLDEADRMLDMGFREDIEKLLAATPPERQTVLFSATFPPDIEALSARFQREPARITVAAEAPPEIRQLSWACEPDEKPAAILRILRHFQPISAIAFVQLKATADELARFLRQNQVSADSLQGDLEQEDRERVMAKFRNQSTRVLVATDVAARGLDVASVDAVINYDWPNSPEVYVHRIGRTGRAGRAGLAFTLVTARDAARVEQLENAANSKLVAATLEPVSEAALDAPMQTLVLFAGRKDKLRPGDVLGALTGDAGLPATEVGKIEVLDRVAFVAVKRETAPVAFERLRNGRIKGRKIRVERVR